MKSFLTVVRKPLQSKVLLVMKLTTLIILFFALNVSANGFGQDKISVRAKKTEISGVLRSIEKQSNYRFLYNNNLQDIREKVTINVKDASISDVLNQLLGNTRLLYQLMDNNLIVIKEDPNAPIIAQAVTITGVVRGENGTPLASASVVVKGTSTGTTTRNDGTFTLEVDNANVTLFVSSVGYEPQEIALAGRTSIDVTLVASTKVMEQVIVVGYGSQRKLDVTGSVVNIKGEELAKQASINPISALQGKVAGVHITNSGAPGASPEIRIRGLGTVYGNPNPLYVVDGVWFDDISFLNPADIESLSVLKDASSQSIYGIRAANGVVLITTKKGRNGRAVVNYNGYVGFQRVTNLIEMANAKQYAEMINELDGTQVLDPADYGEGTDWYGQMLRNALITNHQVSVSGGSERSTYNFSLGYLKQEGIVEKNNYTRYTAKLQNDFNVFSTLKMGYTVTAAASKSDDIPGVIFREMYAAYPVLPVYYADGSYGDPGDWPLGDGAKFNPQVTLDFFDQESKNYRLTGNVYADLKFARKFTFRSSLGGEFGQGEVRNYLPVYAATLNQRNTTSRLSLSRAETRNWILENTLTYDTRFTDHNLKVLIGQSAQQYKSYGWSASAQNVPNNSEGDRYLRLGTVDTRNVNDFGDLATVSSYFGRVNYSFRNRYMLTASLRADGSSKFFGDDRWGYFPSIGLGWVISDESFMQNQDIFNNLKLRGSWGKIGNASVPNNVSVLRVTQTDNLTSVIGGAPATGASIDMVVPPTTVWERAVGTDIGLEASMLDSRLYFEADYYVKKTEQAIFNIPIPGSVGTGSGTILGNQADFENRGFEFALTWRDNIKSDLTYSISANIGFNENKVLSTITGANPIYSGGGAATSGALATRTIVGQPIGEFFGLIVDGIFQNQTEINNSAQSTARPGDFRYVDQNKDGIINDLDRVPIGNPNPRVTYGINTNWAYKNFDLTLDFQGVSGVEIYNANLGLRFGRENFTRDFYENRWHGEGTSNEYPSVKIGGGDNYKPNTFYVEDGSYFRVRNMQLGYTFDKSLTDRWKIGSLRVFVNAQNALNFFKYRGFNPEVGGSPGNAGIDANVYPMSATYNFGVNLSL